MKRLFIILIVLLGTGKGLQAQSLTRTNLYTANPFYNAPIVITDEPSFVGFAGYNSRYSGLDNAPQALSMGIYADFSDKMGMGLRAYNDTKGIFESFYANLSYQYRVYLDGLAGAHQLTFGLAAGVVNRNLQQSRLSSEGLSDPVLLNNTYNETNFNAGFAVNYSFNQLNVLVSLPELTEQNVGFRDKLFTQASYLFLSPTRRWTFSPVVAYYRHPTREQVLDGSLKVGWNELLWVQPGYRSNGNFFGALGVKAGPIEVAYAYELNQQMNRDIAGSSNEVAVIFRLGKKKETTPKKEDLQPKVDSLTRITQQQSAQLAQQSLLLAEQVKRYNELSENQQELEQRMAKFIEDESNIPEINDIEPGFYLVISAFDERARALDAASMLKTNRITINVAYDQDKGKYYVYTLRSDSRQEAIDRMQQLRRSGLKEAWVLVIK
mgnify:CR=1 FL=1